MMCDIADYVDGISNEMPIMLETVLRCKRWGIPPRSGGLEEQPVWLPDAEQAIYTYNAFVARNRATSAVEFSEQFPSEAEYCFQIDQMRGINA